MSAVNESKIIHIKDEDLLKKMWHETEDFGRKKEIRAHMYKLREERLKDLYCNSDVKDIHLITNKKTSFNQSMHADALADHSFASLKRKEIRDSESPTKDISYRMKGPSINEGWNISKIEEHSQDGKNHKISQSAHTSGTEYIPQGKLDFEAKNNQELTTYHDGDDKNFVKSQGTSSNSFIRQEAVGGDGNSSFRTSSSQSSSSSRTVTEQKSTYGDAIDYPKQSMIDHGGNSNNFTSSTSVNTSRTDTNKDVGDYTRKQVILESANRDDQNNYRTSSTNATSSSKIVTESHKSQDDYSRKQVSDSDIIDRTTKVYTTDAPRELKSHPGYVEGRTKITRETKTLADGTVVTTTKYETKGVDEVKSASSNQYISSSSTFQDNKSNVITSKSHNENFSTQKVNEDRDKPSTKHHQPKSRYYVEKTHTIPDTTENIHHNIQSRRESNVSEKKFDTTKNIQSHVDQRYEIINDLTEKRLDTKNTENVRKQTTQHIELEDSSTQRKENVRKETVDRKRVQQKTVATHDVNSVPLGTPIEIEINLTRINDNQEFKGREPQVVKQAVPKSEPENVYDTPKRREPIKHHDEITTKHKITDGQYDTTYRTDYTTKKISVEVSPTHDAFARSLRAVSPDRLSSRTSSRNLKSSNSSLRSSSSPEKNYSDRRHPQRMSPDRYTNGRYHSPTKKTPEKFSSTETITYKSVSRPNSQRISPDKSQRNKHTNEIKLTSNISTSTKKTDDKTYKTSQSPPKNTPRTSIPNNEQRTNVYEITTDLDDNISTYSHSTVTTSKTDKRNSNVDSKTVEEFYINDQNKPVNKNHTTIESPRKDKPIDRPLKRTDTYEERCRQILGITSDSNEKRRSSLEKLRKRGSIVQSPTDSPTKTTHESPEKKPHESPRQKSPTKQGVPLQEFPSQIRRSPEKCSPEKRIPKEPSPTKGRKPSVEGKNIQEYPSQTRKTPEKPDGTSFPRRSSDVRQERKPSNERKPIQEFPSQIRRTPEKYPSEDQHVTPKHTDSEKPSTHQKPLGEYPSQRHMSPDKKQSPSRSSPRKPNETNQETTNVDITSRTTSQLIIRDESENKNQATYSKDNIRIQTTSNTSDTSYEQPSPTKHLPRKSPEKIAPAGSPDKHQRTTEVTTTLSSSLKNENITNITRNESLPDDRRPSIGKDRSKKPSHKEPTTTKHKPNDDSSSEEDDIEVNQVKITEQVIYDIPRSAVHKISSDEVKTTDEEKNTIISRTNINKQHNESNMKTITSDFISEEAQNLLIESAIDEQDDTETPLNTKRGPKDDKSPKSSQPIDKNQTKSKPFNLHDVRTIEQIDIVEDISMNKNTATEEKVTKSKTVGELVESFTLREEDNIRKPYEKPRDSNPNSCPMPKKSSLTKKYDNMVDVENSKITTNQIQINETIKQSSTDSKQPMQPKDGRPSSQEKTPQNLNDIVKPNKYEDTELKKGSSINRTPTDEDLQKPSPQKTQKPDNEKDTKELVVETRSEFTLVSKKPSSTDIQKPNARSPSRKPSEEKVQKSSKDSPHKRPSQQDDTMIVIEVQETITIESDEEIDESKQMFPSDTYPSQISKKIVHVQEDKEEYENSEESGHELTEIEFTTIKRIPNKESNEPSKKSPNKHQPQETKMPQKHDKNQKRDDKEIKQNTTNRTVVQKRIHTENVSKEKDIKKLSQRTPSGSSLSKKPLTHQKLNKKEEVDVEVKNKVSTVRKSFEQKQTKSDSVRKENVPYGRPMNGVPSKAHPSHKPISKKPLETVDKNKKPIKETPSNLDSDSSEAEEEIHTKKHVLETYEGRTPVEEPLIMKKTVSLLYSDDEDEKKATQLLIESEITEIQPITDQKKERPTKTSKMTTTKLINSEKNERTVQKTKPSQKTPSQINNNMSKKPEIPKQPYLTNGVKKDSTKKDTKQNTLKDIETFNTVNEDKKILLRTNRVDETVNKKKTSVMTTHGNTPINKSPDTPKTANGVPKRPSSRQTVTTEKVTTRVTTRTKEPAKPTQKSNKPSIPQRSTMTSTVSSKTKTESKTTKTNAVKSNIKTVESKFKPKPKKIEEPEDSDEESLADSLDESVYSSINDLTSTTQKTEVQTYTSTNIEDLEKHPTSSVKSHLKSVDRTDKESESVTEKKHKATKSIILNNKDRGTVDLQRSISSREPTPDRMCPLPVTSDEEGNAPRYPDKVVEPEESSPKKRYNRLFDTSIHEYGDIQSKKIVEINEDSNQKTIDRVDNDDESLLTVNKKINKFLSTAEKLTEKSVVDISQPAPKVHRPKFEVNDDLKEDDCLLSVSDKVQKFITEAEHLTTYKDTQHRKSVNVEVRSDVVDKINQFTSPQHQKEANLSPRKSSTPKNTFPSSFEETHPVRKEPGKTTIPSQIKLDQDVFITTECAEIEKESDFFRASKNIPKDTKEKPEEHDTPKSSHESKTKKTEIKSTTKKTSVETDEFSYEDTQISEQTDETPTKPRKNSLKEFTPKNRRPSQEEKVILSSVGRLRSNESIKKAKALFDNTESSTREEKRQIDILNRPSVFEGRSKTVKETHSKKVIDRNNVTPKRLDFTTEKRTEDRQIKVESHKRQSSEKDVPRYMKPLDRQSRPEDHEHPRNDHPDYSGDRLGDSHQNPGYMKPLDRSHKHPQESAAPESQDQRNTPKHSVHGYESHKHYTSTDWTYKSSDTTEDNTPGYMKPLDRTDKHHHSQTLSNSDYQEHKYAPSHSVPEDHKRRPYTSNEDDTPGYMKPIDRSHQHHHTSSTPDSEEHRSRPRHSAPEDDNRKHHSSTDWTYKSGTNEDETPGYMKPLDRSSRPQFDSREPSKSPERHTSSERYHEGDKPGYMEPLDRSSRPQFDRRKPSKSPERHTISERYHEGDKPGYMQPLDRSSRPQFDSRDRSKSPESHTTSERYHEGDKPGYMEPLDRSSRPQFDRRGPSKSPERHTISERYHDGDKPGYMQPLDRSTRPQYDSRDRSKSPETKDRYKKPHGYEPSESGPEEDLPGYMKPLDRCDRSRSPKKDTGVEKKPQDTSGTPTKFGVTLKRTDSSKAVTSPKTTTDKKHPLLLKKQITEEEIEEVFDLEVLEELLLKFTIYELRRKIRTQIRIVKKLISEGKLEVTIQNMKNSKKHTEHTLQTRENTKKTDQHSNVNSKNANSTRRIQESQSVERKNKQEFSEYTVESSRKESFSSTYTSERQDSRRSKTPEKKIQERRISNGTTPERASPERKYSSKPSSERHIVEERTTSVQERRTSNRTTPERASPERKYSSKPSSERNIVEERTTSTHSTYTVKEKGRTGESKPPTKTSSPNIFNSSLKKTEPKVKSPTSAPQPEWITQRNLKKTGTNEVVKKSSVSSSSSTIKRQNVKSTNTKETESTDLIASSYGIGPTDENGAPLFGLRALRAQNTNGTTKVQGTVISSQYYSETGKEPVGQISVTKYSSDPRDLGSDEHSTRNGDILSVTTTQKYGYDDTPSLKQLTSTDQEICDSRTNKRKSSTKTSTITRKNSVKALTQKFVENAVEVSKSERQSTYPKAGLILRSSSFKNESATEDGYSEISAEKRMGESVSIKTSHSKSASGGTFLRNKSKVTDVQDAITRMKAEDIQHGDTEEDIEAKDLLNKYLGTQVILSGIEGQVSRTGTSTEKATSFSTSAKSVSRITTVTMENGKEVTRTRTFEHPLSDEVLESVWDEQTLRYLLDQSTDYEERKRIRARLRLIMAEQEACTELVKQASQDQSSQSIDGESLLLPLLQGLLDAPENEQTHDSGTESGEDQRSGLIAEVQNALDKLSMSLKSDATDITAERRSSLLQLVTKLQAGLSSATSDRRHSGQLRFNRRRERPDRHTIGVSNEELADARKLMQEISCPSQSSSKTSLIPKQNSESSVNKTTSYNPINQKSSVKNATPKPFSCSNSTNASTDSSSVQTPSESMDCLGYLFNEETKDYPGSDTSPTNYNNRNIDNQSSYKASQDYYNAMEDGAYPDHIPHKLPNIDSEEDECSTIKPDTYAKPDLLMQSNPIYYQPNREEDIDNKKNRFTTKKLKMRRANTIDIPKPLHFYECDDDEETDVEEEERRRRSNYLALRGPIRVGNVTNRNSVPALEPKTENDKKFLAFITKHNQKNQRHSMWASKTEKSSIWNNKFDHIKTNFEKNAEVDTPRFTGHFTDDSIRFGSKKYDPKISKQTAMNLKRMFEEKQRLSNERRNSVTTENSFKSRPVETEKNVRFIPQPLPVNKFSHAPSSAFQPVPRNFNVPTDENHHRSTSFRPIPDKETHRKQNEELPEITKSVLQINDTKGSNRLFLYSPKPLHNRESVSPTSPGFAKPWVGNTGESRVLTLAAKKFENPAAPPNSSFQPRRLSREKINAIPNFQMSNNEKLTAPYLVKSLEQPSNTVRKLSGQYDNLGYQPNRFERSPQQSAFPSNKKLVDGFQPKFTVPQNYSIRYDRPKVNTERFPPVHNTTPAEVKKYNQFHPEKQTTSQYYAPRHDHNFCRVTQPSSHQTHTEVPNNYERRLSNQKLNQIVTKQEYDHDDPHTKEQPKYQAQTRVKTEVYDNPRIEINDLEKETGKNEGSRPSYVSQSSVESLKEYGAISSRVMSGPVAQVASTVKQKSPMTRNEHDIQAAFALKSALQKVNNATSPNPQPNANRENLETSENYRRESRNQENTDRPHERNVIFNNVRSNNQHLRSEERPRAPTKPSVSESHEVTARGEHIVTGKLPLHPSINVQPSFNKPTQAQLLSKSDSWHQICLMNQAPPQHKPAPRSAPSNRNIMKSKSTHSVIPAKQFEAGMTKDEVAEKRRTMEAFFGGGYASQQQSKSPSPGKVVKRAINRTKTSEKNVQYKQYQAPEMPTGLARSRTLPDIVCLDLLDENNVDQAFEDLFTSS